MASATKEARDGPGFSVLESQAVVSSLIWILEAKVRSSGRSASTLDYWAISSALSCSFFFLIKIIQQFVAAGVGEGVCFLLGCDPL